MSANIFGTIKMDEVHNIVAEQNGWGQLENGTWINLKFTVPYIEEKAEVVEVVEEIPTIFVTGMSVVEEVDAPVVGVTEVATDAEEVSIPEYRKHKVKKGGVSGESLWEIAERYLDSGERCIEIKELNNLKSDVLRAGMVLKIPMA